MCSLVTEPDTGGFSGFDQWFGTGRVEGAQQSWIETTVGPEFSDDFEEPALMFAPVFVIISKILQDTDLGQKLLQQPYRVIIGKMF